jgi:hypothetical protein
VARPVEDLPIRQPDGRPAVDRSIQISFEVRIPPGRRIVKHPAIEFDHEPFAVLGIAIADADGRRRTLLSDGSGQPVRSFDANKIAMLKDRAGTVGDVDENRSQPSATTHAPARIQSFE